MTEHTIIDSVTDALLQGDDPAKIPVGALGWGGVGLENDALHAIKGVQAFLYGRGDSYDAPNGYRARFLDAAQLLERALEESRG